ncbi:hypothetical protein SNE40_019528 [Patella caerulea]|uniref:Uncharacterized protein n=1 Tax=Patella caerulea TaxID=87958 RepID=A0AAN8PFT9_PATCE
MASWRYIVALLLFITATVFAIDCEYEGKTYTDGISTTIDEFGPCITYSCKNGNFAPSEILCADKDGNCKKPGDTFSLVIDNKTWDTCSCTISDDNKVNYSC